MFSFKVRSKSFDFDALSQTFFAAGIVTNSCHAIDMHSHHPIAVALAAEVNFLRDPPHSCSCVQRSFSSCA